MRRWAGRSACSRKLSPQNEIWLNDRGEPWSVAKLVRHELDKPIDSAPDHGPFRLLAIASAIQTHRDELVDGDVCQEAHYQLLEYIKIARESQNDDGSFSTNGFRGPRLGSKAEQRESEQQARRYVGS